MPLLPRGELESFDFLVMNCCFELNHKNPDKLLLGFSSTYLYHSSNTDSLIILNNLYDTSILRKGEILTTTLAFTAFCAVLRMVVEHCAVTVKFKMTAFKQKLF